MSSRLILALVASLPFIHTSPLFRRQSATSAWCTSSDLSRALAQIDAPTQGDPGAGSGQQAWDLTIDDTASGHKQTIDGFGAAVTDATVTSFNQLDSATLDKLLNEVMTDAGANFSFLRHTIGSSDLSGDPAYTYDDNGNNADPNIDGFGLGDRGESMIDMLKQMKAKNGGMKVLGSPWSPPGWMKVNNQLTGTATNNNLLDQYLDSSQTDYSDAFAKYFVKYIQAYESAGVNIDAITLQNEPLNSQGGYPTMYMYDYEQAKLAQNHVGPALQSAGLGTSIWAYDHNTDKPDFPQHVLDGAGQYVDTVAWHCYATDVDWTVLSTFHDTNPNAKQYMTECWTPVTNDSNWSQAAEFTMGPLQNWAAGVMAWTLGTNSAFGPFLSTGGCDSCRGLVTIQDDGTYTYNMAYYLMAHFSKFMPRGATVLNGTGSYSYSDGSGVQSVATVNPDGTRSVVIVNKQSQDLYLRLKTNSGETWTGTVPTKSTVTWVLPASA